ncbi:hypothetical protein NDU88_002700 [Pleurodeles waltl]|uniref:Uncharacterized protein n=1 Tax=Pleurodeles waltl TaxID=8319 RepID=A0AAV7W5C0_PLEWA|nr:hypothetical protein NDU88_002700 [Pleurodeles waltl]
MPLRLLEVPQSRCMWGRPGRYFRARVAGPNLGPSTSRSVRAAQTRAPVQSAVPLPASSLGRHITAESENEEKYKRPLEMQRSYYIT